MSKLKIITDSASDITYAEEAAYGIRVIPFPIALDGKSYLSRVDFDNQGFYTLMNQHPDALPTTSQITPFQFQEMMEEEVAKGADEPMFLLINSKGSATYSNAVMAKDAYFDEHPEQQGKVKIAVIDSGATPCSTAIWPWRRPSAPWTAKPWKLWSPTSVQPSRSG